MPAAPTHRKIHRDQPHVRPLAVDDLDAVVQLDAALNGRRRIAYFERRLAAAGRAPKAHAQFAVEDAGVLSGYVLAKVLEGEFGRAAPAMRLEVIGVSPSAQGRGLGAALGEALETETRQRGLAELRTGASWRDHAMLRWLDVSGWTLGGNHVIECTLSDAPMGGSNEAPVLRDLPERPADANDYGAAAPNDFDALARDLADVRTMRLEDTDDVARIDRRLTGRDRSAYIRHRMEEALADSGVRVSLIARTEDSVAGYLMASADYGDFGRPQPAAVIDTLGVDPGFAGRGLGRAMLSQLFVNLGALGIERVETVVTKSNYDLLGFFYRNGFAPGERLAFAKRL